MNATATMSPPIPAELPGRGVQAALPTGQGAGGDLQPLLGPGGEHNLPATTDVPAPEAGTSISAVPLDEQMDTFTARHDLQPGMRDTALALRAALRDPTPRAEGAEDVASRDAETFLSLARVALSGQSEQQSPRPLSPADRRQAELSLAAARRAGRLEDATTLDEALKVTE